MFFENYKKFVSFLSKIEKKIKNSKKGCFLNFTENMFFFLKAARLTKKPLGACSISD